MEVETSTVVLGAFALLTSTITVAGAIMGPVILSRARTREKKEEYEIAKRLKEEDYARQDKVAADLARRQDEIAAKVELNARRAAESAAKLEVKVDGVHTLVNSGLTNEKQKTLAIMLELIELRREQGKEPSPDILIQVDMLKKELEERKRQDTIVTKEQELASMKMERQKSEDARRDEREAAGSPAPPSAVAGPSQTSLEALAQSKENAARLTKLEAPPVVLTPRPLPPPIPAPAIAITIEPVKVADDRVAVATERMAEAAEKSADAATETASAATKTAEATAGADPKKS